MERRNMQQPEYCVALSPGHLLLLSSSGILLHISHHPRREMATDYVQHDLSLVFSYVGAHARHERSRQ